MENTRIKKSNTLKQKKSETSRTTVNEQSEISLTASKAGKSGKTNTQKSRAHGTDALSAPLHYTAIERRSGLQEVDDEYLRQNIFAKPILRQTNMYMERENGLNMIKTRTLKDGSEKESEMQMKIVGDEAQSNVDNSAARLSAGSEQIFGNNQNSGKVPQDIPVAQSITLTNGHKPMSTSDQIQVKVQKTREEQCNSLAQKHQKQVFIPVVSKPEICTTCPNCRATIYLVRVDLPPEDESNAK